jgi:hypothetical protein
MSHRISWETREKRYIKILKYSRMYPCSCPCISWLFSRIVVGSIGGWILEFERDLIMSCLDLLHQDDIWIIGGDEGREFSLVVSRSDTVDIPGDDTHSGRRLWFDSF